MLVLTQSGAYQYASATLEAGEVYYVRVYDFNNENGYTCFDDVYGNNLIATTPNGNPNNRPAEVNALTITQANATVTLGETGQDVSLYSIVANDAGTLVTPGNLSLTKGESTVDNLTVNGVLTLGAADTQATLKSGGTLVATGGITYDNVGSTVEAEKLETSTLNVDLTENFMAGLQGGSATLLKLDVSFTGSITLNDNMTLTGIDDTLELRSEDNKYIYTLSWETQMARATSSTWYLVLNSTVNSSYVQEKLAGVAYSHNGYAGLSLLSRAFAELNPQANNAAGASDLAELIDTVDAAAMTDSSLAALAGASVAVLGQSFNSDVARQLRVIRNRAASAGNKSRDTKTIVFTDEKGASISSVNLTERAYSVWVNAEGNRTEENADGTAAGYTLSSWGGTVGAGMQVNNGLSLGMALTAVYGDLQSDGPDYLDGDMDTSYLSAFVDYRSRAWKHAFIGTIGTMEADYKRTVKHAAGSYSTVAHAEGTAFGLMYELSREFALSDNSSICPVLNISYRHTKVDSFNERHSDAALCVGDQSLDTVTIGVGARFAATVGQQMVNRSCAFEARALAKYDFGDRRSEAMVGFFGQDSRANIESAELGAFGLEFGAGISVPMGIGSIFADGAVELRSDYTNLNATVGYSIQF